MITGVAGMAPGMLGLIIDLPSICASKAYPPSLS